MAAKKEVSTEPRKILVHGDTDFVIEIAPDVRLTFGPWSPPANKESRFGERHLTGTLRLYKGTATTQNIIGIYTNVTGFRDLDVKHSSILSLPICYLCKQNLVIPGDDLCASCSGQREEQTGDDMKKSILTQNYSNVAKSPPSKYGAKAGW